jgi:hypothetical protein
MQTQLLCTFTNTDELETVLQNIREHYHLVYNYIYVLQNKSDLDELFITYNIDTELSNNTPLPNTILMHRKKQSNTLYTINALNQLIKEENGGRLDTKFQLDWDKFKNSIILTNASGTKKIQTRIFQIIEFSE